MIAAWVIGARGMLGSSLARELGRRDSWSVARVPPLPWDGDLRAVRSAALDGASRLLAEADGGRWAVLWAGGSAVTSSSDDQVERELAQLESALEGMRPALSAHSGGALFYCSSAGGVYAGSANPPFTETSAPAPLAPYGRLKLTSERVVTEFADSIEAAAVVGRMANLYGPGQRLDKLQGLISHIALAHLTSEPATIYVPLGTLRDYLYIDDAAARIVDAVERVLDERGTVTKILASGRATSIAEVLDHFTSIYGERPPVVLGESPRGAFQALDLRLRSEFWTDLDAGPSTSLPRGIRATIADLESAVRGRPRTADRSVESRG